MALGIGVNISLFSVVRGVLWTPLPYREPGRLVALFEQDTNNKDLSSRLPVDAGSFAEWQSATQGIAQFALVSTWQHYNISAEGNRLPEQIDAAWCSWNLFEVLGVTPSLGRSFTAEDDRPDAQATVMLTALLWQRRYGGDRSIVGRTIWLDSKPYIVIGVLPASFQFSGSFGGNTIRAWTAVRHEAPYQLMRSFEDHEFLAIARLASGTSMLRMAGRLDALQKQIRAERPRTGVHDSVKVRPMLDDAVAEFRAPLYSLFAFTGCVLAIACLNVAGLTIARMATRTKDVAIRVGLGAGYFRLVRERLIESLLLSFGGGAGGFVLALGAIRWFVTIRPEMTRVGQIDVDGLAALFALLLIGLCAIISGVIATLGVSGRKLLASLQESARSHTGGKTKTTLRKTLLVMEIGLTVVLLVAAGLMLKSYVRLRATDLGVPVNNVLTMHVSLPRERYKEPGTRVEFFATLIERVRVLPGVEAAGLISTAPGQGWGGDELMSVVGRSPTPSQDLDVLARGAEPGYLSAIRLPLLRGRFFTADERLDRAHVAVLSESAARRWFPSDDPIGKVTRNDGTGTTYEIVGIVGDVRYDISVPPMPMMYTPLYGNNYSEASVVARSAADAESLAIPIQRVIRQIDPDMPVSNVMTLRQSISKSTMDSQFDSFIIIGFAVIALLLAGVGLFGVLAYVAAQRTNEIGIRLALGAQPRQVLLMMLVDGLKPTFLGLAMGIAGSVGAGKLIQSILYETKPLDLSIIGIVSIILLLVALIACALPAWRASRVDPLNVLRIE